MAGTEKVTYSKPKVSGGIYRAPLGTKLPADAVSALDQAFKTLGYVSEDGVTNSNSPETSDTKAWGGAVVLSAQTSRADTFKVKLIEALNSEVLKLSYGDDRVTGTVETGLTVKAGPGDTEESTYVVDMILKGGALKRIVIPDAALTALGDIVYKDGEPVGYEVTLTAYPDESGMTHYEYIKGGGEG